METYKVKILGSEYNIKADRDGEHVSRVATIVDQRMREVSARSQSVSTGRAAVLACLSLVDEYLTRSQEETDRVRQRVGKLIEKLESVLER
ncbi:MAG: cell division protein ZapA [candidate division WOR-3 bacterium]